MEYLDRSVLPFNLQLCSAVCLSQQDYIANCLAFIFAGINTNDILESFGEMFFEFCQESGYQRILQVLGGSLRDFISNLDALHDHLGSIYPGMSAPSFRVSDQQSDGALILHYYSEREGLEHIVIGIIKTVARKLLNTEVSVEVIQQKGDKRDHAQFVIKEMGKKYSSECSSMIKKFDPMRNSIHLCGEPKISPASFCRAFPFHLMFDSELNITMSGNSVRRVIPTFLNNQSRMTDIFELVRPQMDFTFDAFLAHINTVFVLKTLERIPLSPNRQSFYGDYMRLCGLSSDLMSLRLKGQMVHIPESDSMLFLCSPSVGNLDDLQGVGLYLSDIPIHDATRDLILLSEEFKAEYVLTQQLEVLTDKLKQTHKALEEEKKLTDQLLYSILPPSVANELRHKRPVKAEKFELVTILFSGIVNFSDICKNSKPMNIVQLLNHIYTKFDLLTDSSINSVYKVMYIQN